MSCHCNVEAEKIGKTAERIQPFSEIAIVRMTLFSCLSASEFMALCFYRTHTEETEVGLHKYDFLEYNEICTTLDGLLMFAHQLASK